MLRPGISISVRSSKATMRGTPNNRHGSRAAMSLHRHAIQKEKKRRSGGPRSQSKQGGLPPDSRGLFPLAERPTSPRSWPWLNIRSTIEKMSDGNAVPRSDEVAAPSIKKPAFKKPAFKKRVPAAGAKGAQRGERDRERALCCAAGGAGRGGV